MAIAEIPLEPFGVEITGATGPSLVDSSIAAECQKALDRHGVVVYRELDISDEDLVRFTRLLGDPVLSKTGEHRMPEVETITLDPAKTNAALAGYRKGNFHWHIDGATIDVPQKATLLAAREVDPAGGDTEFANTFLAYDALPGAERDKLEGLQVRHSFAAAQLRANPEASESERASWNRVPEKVQPLIWTRSSGVKSMLLGATASEVVGMSTDEGAALLQRLLAWATQPHFVLRHRWRRGDLVIWDNTGMLHRAIPFEPTSRRLMHRTTLAGVEAVA
ncbi:taurine catabolism dioxygenase TauD [Mycobacterium colombiense]|uniref:TauD/TfdA dioxygenase family protein n=1 Tax=Mycobacterium colombiense TaxID=339268 RepID=UPI0007EF840F|nr:TauD/TfdA family dioxygenase [Mycobacterium colombiense]OBK63203.1 taurine catabolism dioxygenase TauD [Mycobacterium colombiense]